mgnify:CR=1 FL=1|tara:strand:+ start:43 stop:507 length:465 start_codon:yes stop_codon:yes gene_type:complete
MADATEVHKGMTIAYETGDFTNGTVDVLLDIDFRTGTPVDETNWLDGNAGGDYPGSLTGFVANNSDGNAAGSMRLVTIAFTLADDAEQTMVFTAGVSKMLGVIGTTFAVADKTLSATFTNAGTAAYAKTGGALPGITLHGEAAGAGTVTVLLLN